MTDVFKELPPGVELDEGRYYIELDAITLDNRCQPRVEISDDVVREYRHLMFDEAKPFPPVVIFSDGTTNWLADGWHRFLAIRETTRPVLPCELHKGTVRDAILYSLGANAAHGLRRTNADKRRAVMTMLTDEEWKNWPQGDIAKACGVSRQYVILVEADIGSSCQRLQDTTRTVTRNGKTYTQNTGKIGKPKKEKQETLDVETPQSNVVTFEKYQYRDPKPPAEGKQRQDAPLGYTPVPEPDTPERRAEGIGWGCSRIIECELTPEQLLATCHDRDLAAIMAAQIGKAEAILASLRPALQAFAASDGETAPAPKSPKSRKR